MKETELISMLQGGFKIKTTIKAQDFSIASCQQLPLLPR